MDDQPLIERNEHGPVTILTMVYRPHNLIGPKLMGALKAELHAAQAAQSRAIVIRSGLRHFSAGADVTLFDDQVGGQAGGQPANLSVIEFLQTLEQLPIPIIASVHGVCLGGGFELALACDYIIASASAKFGSVEATLGLNPLMGGVQRQVERVGALRAKEMSMLARRYDSATLERWGLINLTVPDEALESTTLSIAEEFGNGPTVAHAATKALAYIAANEGVAAADAAMAAAQAPIWASEDLKTGLTSFRTNGPGLAQFKGR